MLAMCYKCLKQYGLYFVVKFMDFLVKQILGQSANVYCAISRRPVTQWDIPRVK